MRRKHAQPHILSLGTTILPKVLTGNPARVSHILPGRPPLTCRGAVVRHPPLQLHLVLVDAVTPELVEPGWDFRR